MLTFLPLGLLHFVRDAAAAVRDLAEFGLEVLCDEHDHGHLIYTLGQEQEAS